MTSGNLLNEMQIVCLPVKSQIEICGLAINAGSRDERDGHFGLAHFVEHTIFKGTTHRRSAHIGKRMEAVGGELNAYTTKEDTIIYSIFPKGNLERATELIADLVMNPTFPEAEIEKERRVVCDEINSYLDIPSEGIFDDFEDRIYAGSELGHNILGTLESVEALNSRMCLDWVHTHFVPLGMVFFYAGPLDYDRVRRIAERHLGFLLRRNEFEFRHTPERTVKFDDEVSIDCHQAHTVIGAPIGGYLTANTHALALATNILGGPGMNSLLNVELRERRGLVYTIDASTSLFDTIGTFTIYFGCDSEDRQRCRRLVGDVVSRLADSPLSPRRLEAAKRQLLGQLTVANANMENAVTSMARQLLHKRIIETPEQTAERISAVKAETLRDVLDSLRPECCSTLTFV